MKNAGDAELEEVERRRPGSPGSTPDREISGKFHMSRVPRLRSIDSGWSPDRVVRVSRDHRRRSIRATPILRLAAEHHEQESRQRDGRRRAQHADQPQDRKRVLAGGRVVVVAEQEQPADRRADPPGAARSSSSLKLLGRKIDAEEVAGDDARRASRRPRPRRGRRAWSAGLNV